MVREVDALRGSRRAADPARVGTDQEFYAADEQRAGRSHGRALSCRDMARSRVTQVTIPPIAMIQAAASVTRIVPRHRYSNHRICGRLILAAVRPYSRSI